MDHHYYLKIEQGLIKNMNKITIEELIKILHALKKNGYGTPTFFMIMDHKLLN